MPTVQSDSNFVVYVCATYLYFLLTDLENTYFYK